MKQLVIGVIFLWTLFLADSAAQGRGGGGRFSGGAGKGGGYRGGNFGLPPVKPIPPLGSFGRFNRFRNQRYGSGALGWGYSAAFDGYGDAGYSGQYQIPIMVMPEPESYTPPPPPPVRPELHQYTWPESGSDPTAVFAIVSKNGNVRPAVAVWVQGDTVRYITPEDHDGRLALDSVDREATRSANAAKHLVLALPAPSSLHR
jgi:hypothetical protein